MASTLIDRLDGLSSSAAIKGPVKAATTANITLYGEQTIDGVAVVDGDRVLVKDQTAGYENGIYVVDTGQWRRARDFNRTRDVVTGTQVFVTSGTAGADRWYGVTTANPVDIGTSTITFSLSDNLAAVEEALEATEEAAALAIAAASNVVSEQASRSYAVANYHPTLAPDFIRTSGYSSAGDDGGALYKKSLSEPSHAGKLSITLSGGSTTWYEIVGTRLPFEALGGVGDGVTNGAVLMQAAINMMSARGGGIITLEAKTYFFDGDCTIPSGVTIAGKRGATRIKVGTNVNKLFRFLGSEGATVAFSATAARGATALTTAAHGLVDNDFAFILSGQSVRAYSDEWTLSADNQEEYFGEFVDIKDAPTTTTLTVEGGIFWPTYPLTTSTVRKITPCSGSVISGIIFDVDADMQVLVEGFWAKDCRVEDCRANMGLAKGLIVHWWNSFNCVASRVSGFVDVNADIQDANFFNYNLFQCSGATACGFEYCGGENSSTCFDITFQTNGWPSFACFVKNSWTISCRYNPVTVHPGCYAPEISGNRFIRSRRSNISCRSRKAIITNNVILCANAADATTYGIALHEGWARDCIIENNTIEGVGIGVYIFDSSGDAQFGYIGALIKNNNIRHCARGVDRTTSLTNANTAHSGLVIAGNHLSYVTDRLVSIDDLTHGVVIEDNVSFGAASRGYYVENSNSPSMWRNRTYDIGSGSTPFWIASGCAGWNAAGNESYGLAGVPSYPSDVNSSVQWSNNVGNASIFLADDAATSIQLPSNHAMVIVTGFRSPMNGIAYLQLATAGTKLAGHANFIATTGTLAGTTGTDGNVTVSIGTGNVLYIENRSGNADTLGIHIIASSS